ncbi:hypothetical protein QWA68_015821 [Fusarium oxysporum]|nr:hypothetical protein QWA68_015821 [Fusarium oxysporum]
MDAEDAHIAYCVIGSISTRSNILLPWPQVHRRPEAVREALGMGQGRYQGFREEELRKFRRLVHALTVDEMYD